MFIRYSICFLVTEIKLHYEAVKNGITLLN